MLTTALPDPSDESPSLRPSVVRVVEQLREQIHCGELVPGQRLAAERHLADRLRVSRPTVREALRLLRSDGYLTVTRGATGGTFVTALTRPRQSWLSRMRSDPAELEELFEIRIVLETTAAAWAATRRGARALRALESLVTLRATPISPPDLLAVDATFHRVVASASGNHRLAQAIQRIRGELFAPFWQLAAVPELLHDPIKEHRQVVAAIRARSPNTAARAMRRHLERTREEFRNAIAARRRPRARAQSAKDHL